MLTKSSVAAHPAVIAGAGHPPRPLALCQASPRCWPYFGSQSRLVVFHPVHLRVEERRAEALARGP
eukprot:11701118-Heterocapsa_arctica.AAC.1